MSKGFDWETTAGVHWSKAERDFMCGGPTRATGALLAFDFVGSKEVQSLLAELDKRGYDLETLRFSVKKKKEKEESLSMKFFLAKQLIGTPRDIQLLSILKTLEEQERTDEELYSEVKSALRRSSSQLYNDL